MQPISGLDLLEKVRADGKQANLRFIMMTADSTIDKIIKAKHAGVTCFINKPFRAEDLKAKIVQVDAEHRSLINA